MNKFKKGDKVIVLSGKDKGKTGQISQVLTKDKKCLIEGINIVKKHKKDTDKTKSAVVEEARPIYWSKLSLADNGKPVSIAYKEVNGKKVRVSKKNNQVIG